MLTHLQGSLINSKGFDIKYLDKQSLDEKR